MVRLSVLSVPRGIIVLKLLSILFLVLSERSETNKVRRRVQPVPPVITTSKPEQRNVRSVPQGIIVRTLL